MSQEKHKVIKTPLGFPESLAKEIGRRLMGRRKKSGSDPPNA